MKSIILLLVLGAAGCHSHAEALKVFQKYREGAAPVVTLTAADVVEWNAGADDLERFLGR